ncbi:hypothetical protein N7509_006201 [Penicillium cosmopolitanum]|uniref:Uncharacterized protein n=1 Tax=Penicillium cosmopolitanum TaxID=1131564 RepID=A0A9X0BAT9_9EURO|nr:uncharacterized protein N7509_006201 [Penicillium cosmopolitanum]KAJ5398088.1 hypothetical protein N7509_006201 [Penicillium cosmopolitanum]
MNSTDTEPNHGQPPQNWQANGSTVPWAEIFSRHEAVLVSHREMLDSVKGHIAPDGEAFRAVSAMLNKTVQAMNQTNVMRKHMLNKKTNEYTASDEASPIPEPRKKKKRSRLENEEENDVPVNHNFETSGESPVSKRKLNPTPPLHLPDESQNTSSAYETEDISAEVQRRLLIKEERRRKKENAQPEKRKRESLISNESLSPGGGQKPQKKRVRVGSELRRDGGFASGRAKRQKQ